jgi:hypothetical protein
MEMDQEEYNPIVRCVCSSSAAQLIGVQAAGLADDSPADQDRVGLQGGCTLYTVHCCCTQCVRKGGVWYALI